MKKISIYITALFFSLITLGQLEITIYGDANDSTIIKRKQAMEEKGFSVQIKPEASKDTDEDNPFIKKWTNKKMPQFNLVDLDGNSVSSKDLEGKLVHINFWSVTCKPCIEEFPELNELKEKYKDKVVFLAIAPESEKKVNRVLNRHDLAYQTIAGAREYFETLGIEGYPKNLFLNEDGSITKIIDGTHYTIEYVNDKPKMKPDNFKYYDKVLAGLVTNEQ